MTPPRRLFHSMENFFEIFPHNGKRALRARIAARQVPTGRGPNVARSQHVSTLWKTFFPALFLLAAAARADLTAPPELPFPLPDAPGLAIRQTSTVTTPDQFLHVVEWTRPLEAHELDEFSAMLAARNWKPQLDNSPAAAASLQRLQALAPTAQLQQPFGALLQLLGSGVKSWSLDPIQLVYTPGETASLALSFPLPSNAVPPRAGTFTADLPLPLADAVFSQTALQASDTQTTRMETWLSNTPPELFLPQTESLLVAAGWTPPSPPIPPGVNPENQASRARLLFMETLMKNVFRVYHRNASQFSILHTPAPSTDPGGPAHSYTFILRTFLQWPSSLPTP